MKYVFGPYTLETECYELRSAEGVIPLGRQGFTTLVYLIEHRDRVVLRQELFDHVWPNCFVSNASLEQCIAVVRRAVKDSGRVQRVIQTVCGRGYRFVADVLEPIDNSPGVGVVGRSSRCLNVVIGTIYSEARQDAEVNLPPVSPVRAFPPEGFVGRKQELTQLQQWYTKACYGQRQIGFITGEAGIGKTSLVEAFISHVMATEHVWVGQGQCIEQYGSGEPYLPLLAALGRLCRRADAKTFKTLLQQHAPSWLVQMPALLTPGEREALLHQDHGVLRDRMLRELAEAIEIITAERPLILVLEDLHWSDSATLDWLHYVSRRRDPARLLLLVTYRPVEARVNKHPVRAVMTDLKQRHQGVELALEYLCEEDVAAYLAQRCRTKPFPAGLAHRLHRRTSGNPLFLITVVDELIRQRKLTEGVETWELCGGIDVIDAWMPETLRALIDLQVEQLDPCDQTLLEAASVAGIEFTVATLAAGLEDADSEVEARCAVLAQRGQFLQGQEPAAWPDGTVTSRYEFRHALYHEVLYHRLPAARRSLYHTRIGRRLACGFGQETEAIAAELAMHFVCGHQPSQAVPYLGQAGLNAERRGAYQEAIHYLTLGLDQLMTLPATPERDRRELDMLIAMGQPLRVVKGLSSVDVGHVLARARKLCQQIGNKQQLSRVLFGLWNFHVTRGELQMAYELAEHLCALRPLRDSRNLGYTLLFRGEFTAAWAHLKRSMTFKDAQHALSRLATIYLYSYASWNLWLLGYPDQALHKSREALNLAAAQPHPRLLSIALSRAALLHQFCRTVPRVYELAEATVTASRELGDPQRHAMGTILGGWALAAVGEGTEGLHRMRQGLEAWQATGARLHLPYFLSLLADGYGRMGQAEKGLAVLDEALAIMDTNGMRWAAAQVYHTQGALLLLPKDTTNHPGEAEACLQQAIDVARQQQAKSLELRATKSLARLWQQQGKCSEARALLAPVYGWFTEGFDTADWQNAKALLEELAE